MDNSQDIKQTGGKMSENNDALRKRRDEILAELAKVNDTLRAELDPDGEEQAIEIEQDEVAVSQEANLRRELNEIEDELGETGDV